MTALGVAIGVSFDRPSGSGITPQTGDILLENGTDHIQLQSGVGVILLEGGGSFNPATMPGLLGWWDVSNATLSGGNVTSVLSYGTAPAIVQATVGKQPTVSGSPARMNFAGVSSQSLQTATPFPQLTALTLPDGASGSTSGIGFTCTGLARANDGTWWLGNYGKPSSPGTSTTFAASLVHLSADFKTFLGQITLGSLGITQSTTQTGPQGVCFDTSDNSLWMACPEIGNIYHVSTAGALLQTIAYPNANGLAYDPVADQLVASSNLLPIQWLRKSDGAVQKTLNPNLPFWAQPPVQGTDNGPIDHLFIDANGDLWVMAGQDGHDDSLTHVNATTGAIIASNRLIGCQASEGIYINTVTNVVTIAVDGGYHLGTANQVMTYTCSPGGSVWPSWAGGPLMVMAGIAKTGSVPAGATSIFGTGEPLTTGYYGGLGAYFGSTGTGDLRVIGVDIVDDHAVVSTTEFLFYTTVDFANQLISTWINGVAQSTTAMSGQTIPVANIQSAYAIMGAGIESGNITRYMTGTIANMMLGSSTAAASHLQIEGKLAWDAGAQALLPVGHPYKNAPP